MLICRGGAVCKKSRFLYCIIFFTKSVLQKLSHAIFQHSAKYCKIYKMLNLGGNLWSNAVTSGTKTTVIGLKMKIHSKNSFFVLKWAKLMEKLIKKSIFFSIHVRQKCQNSYFTDFELTSFNFAVHDSKNRTASCSISCSILYPINITPTLERRCRELMRNEKMEQMNERSKAKFNLNV